MKKTRVGLLFGGRSPEHEISITTAASIAMEADHGRIEIVPIYITREGRWLELADAGGLARLAGHVVLESELAPIPQREVLLSGASGAALVPIAESVGSARPIDVLFPALHGQGGEDGSIQGFARLADIACVGAGILGSSLGMDKVSMKRIAAAVGIPVPAYVAFTRADWTLRADQIREEIAGRLTPPVFVKPSGTGSSVGITKVHNLARLPDAVLEAARYDYRLLVEQGINARELEIALLGNAEPLASVVGEVVPSGEFYDYRAKYIDEDSQLFIPADIPEAVAAAAREYAVGIFRALDLCGMARADFLMDRTTGKLYFNEVNTIPGFTPISMYPLLMEASGISYRDLITRLVELAIERHHETRVETRPPSPGPKGEQAGA